MYQKGMIMYICAETPIHAGSGTEIGSSIDLPIQRERHTEFPMIQGSTIKGVLRANACNVGIKDGCKQENAGTCETCNEIFGQGNMVGGISITDARIIAYPVRSLDRVFVWVTCPLILSRYKRDLELVGKQVSWKVPSIEDDKIVLTSRKNNAASIIVEDLELKPKTSEPIASIVDDILTAIPENNVYEEIKHKLKRDLLIVSDKLFRDLTVLTTEIIPRIKIGSDGVVKSGGLWYEEYLPSDTILYSLILIPPIRKKFATTIVNYMSKYDNKIIHIGGNETTGKGFVRLKMPSPPDGKGLQKKEE